MAKPQKLFPYIENQKLEKDIKQIYDWVSKGEVVTTAPNGSKKGLKGEFVFYNNSGTFSLWVNTDNSTTWQQI